MIIPTDKTLDIEADAYLFGIEKFSVNYITNLNITELKKITKKAKQINKQIFIALNNNYTNKDLIELTKLLLEIDTLGIDGIFYYDVALVSLKEKYDLKTKLVWAAEHLVTNYATINYWSDFNVSYACLSSEITLNEIKEIKKNSNIPIMVPIFGYIPMFFSKRHAVKNYLNNFKIDDQSNTNYIEKENKEYPIIDNELGTVVYSSHILNGYNEYLELDKHNIDYVILNSIFIEKQIFKKVVECYRDKENNEQKINELFKNIDKGFLYKETIYQVKKYE